MCKHLKHSSKIASSEMNDWHINFSTMRPCVSVWIVIDSWRSTSKSVNLISDHAFRCISGSLISTDKSECVAMFRFASALNPQTSHNRSKGSKLSLGLTSETCKVVANPTGSTLMILSNNNINILQSKSLRYMTPSKIIETFDASWRFFTTKHLKNLRITIRLEYQFRTKNSDKIWKNRRKVSTASYPRKEPVAWNLRVKHRRKRLTDRKTPVIHLAYLESVLLWRSGASHSRQREWRLIGLFSFFMWKPRCRFFFHLFRYTFWGVLRTRARNKPRP